jgi:hypothetical protein
LALLDAFPDESILHALRADLDWISFGQFIYAGLKRCGRGGKV